MKNSLRLASLIFCLFGQVTTTQADGFQYNEFLAHQAREYDLNLPTVWISEIVTQDDILRSKNVGLLKTPRIVSSPYDSSIAFDVSHFYKSKNEKIFLMGGFSIPNHDGVFSFGYDNGHESEKLKIGKSFMLGYTNHVSLKEDLSIWLSAFKWFGGAIEERPCLDSYNREFSCLTLQPFSDYQGLKETKSQYVMFSLIKQY